MPKLTSDQIRALLGKPPAETSGLVSTDELQALLLQISLALLMVFMIATFVFRAALVLQPNEEHYAALTPLGAHVASTVDVDDVKQQREKLLEHLVQIYNEDRTAFGLADWLTVSADGMVTPVVSHLFDGMELAPATSNKLRSATALAVRKLAAKRMLAAEWFDRVKNRVRDEALIARDRAWLNMEISKRIELLELDTLKLHEGLLTYLCMYYYNHPDAVTDGIINVLVQRYPHLSTDEKRRTLAEINTRLKATARRALQSRGVELLPRAGAE